MDTQELKVNYKKLLNKAAKANGRKETVSYLNRAAKIKSKIYSNNKVTCFRCNGAGFLRISLVSKSKFTLLSFSLISVVEFFFNFVGIHKI